VVLSQDADVVEQEVVLVDNVVVLHVVVECFGGGLGFFDVLVTGISVVMVIKTVPLVIVIVRHGDVELVNRADLEVGGIVVLGPEFTEEVTCSVDDPVLEADVELDQGCVGDPVGNRDVGELGAEDSVEPRPSVDSMILVMYGSPGVPEVAVPAGFEGSPVELDMGKGGELEPTDGGSGVLAVPENVWVSEPVVGNPDDGTPGSVKELGSAVPVRPVPALLEAVEFGNWNGGALVEPEVETVCPGSVGRVGTPVPVGPTEAVELEIGKGGVLDGGDECDCDCGPPDVVEVAPVPVWLQGRLPAEVELRVGNGGILEEDAVAVVGKPVQVSGVELVNVPVPDGPVVGRDGRLVLDIGQGALMEEPVDGGCPVIDHGNVLLVVAAPDAPVPWLMGILVFDIGKGGLNDDDGDPVIGSPVHVSEKLLVNTPVPVGPGVSLGGDVELVRGNGGALEACGTEDGPPVPLGIMTGLVPVELARAVVFENGNRGELVDIPWEIGAVTEGVTGPVPMGLTEAVEFEIEKGGEFDMGGPGEICPVPEGVIVAPVPVEPIVGAVIMVELGNGNGAGLLWVEEKILEGALPVGNTNEEEFDMLNGGSTDGPVVVGAMEMGLGVGPVPVGPPAKLELDIGNGGELVGDWLGGTPVPAPVKDVVLDSGKGGELVGVALEEVPVVGPCHDVEFDTGNGGELVWDEVWVKLVPVPGKIVVLDIGTGFELVAGAIDENDVPVPGHEVVLETGNGGELVVCDTLEENQVPVPGEDVVLEAVNGGELVWDAVDKTAVLVPDQDVELDTGKGGVIVWEVPVGTIVPVPGKDVVLERGNGAVLVDEVGECVLAPVPKPLVSTGGPVGVDCPVGHEIMLELDIEKGGVVEGPCAVWLVGPVPEIVGETVLKALVLGNADALEFNQLLVAEVGWLNAELGEKEGSGVTPVSQEERVLELDNGKGGALEELAETDDNGPVSLGLEVKDGLNETDAPVGLLVMLELETGNGGRLDRVDVVSNTPDETGTDTEELVGHATILEFETGNGGALGEFVIWLLLGPVLDDDELWDTKDVALPRGKVGVLEFEMGNRGVLVEM
jgi:hypothetical protein